MHNLFFFFQTRKLVLPFVLFWDRAVRGWLSPCRGHRVASDSRFSPLLQFSCLSGWTWWALSTFHCTQPGVGKWWRALGRSTTQTETLGCLIAGPVRGPPHFQGPAKMAQFLSKSEENKVIHKSHHLALNQSYTLKSHDLALGQTPLERGVGCGRGSDRKGRRKFGENSWEKGHSLPTRILPLLPAPCSRPQPRFPDANTHAGL